MNPSVSSSLAATSRIFDDAWQELQRSCAIKLQLGVRLDRLPDLSLAEAERRARVGGDLLARIDALDQESLPPDLACTVRVVRHCARTWSREADWYWRVCDPTGVGFFGMFLPAVYCGGSLLNVVHAHLAEFGFNEPGDLDRYLGLVADYARLIAQMATRTHGQAERGMLMPKEQVGQARALMTAFRTRCRENLQVKSERLAAHSAEAFTRELDRRIREQVEPAFDRVLTVLSDEYFSRAPDTVGLGQYAGGADVYAELVELHTTLDLTPEQVHARGLERIASIEAQMRAIREQQGFSDPGAFAAHLQSDGRFRATTVDGVKAVFQRYVDRLEPRFAEFFHNAAPTSYTIEPLPEVMQGSMTFGYYNPPRAQRPNGVYFFNAANLTRQSLFNIGALTYHELVPGHHLHIATQQANAGLHPFRAHSLCNAYNEGWAEYAGTLAGEMGMYESAEERYGRLVMDAFLSCRLVVDTGMNALGWSLAKAREFMRRHSGMSETEIRSETLRYSCDMPGQALAYKLGDTEILAMRERMRSALGAAFDIRDFHAAVLSPGALPLPELARHVELETARLQSRGPLNP